MRTRLTAVTMAACTLACTAGDKKPEPKETPPAIPKAIGPFADTSVTGMYAQLRAEREAGTGYRAWDHQPVHFVSDLNAYGISYLNPAMGDAVTAKASACPVGASSVLELYSDASGGSLSGWAVLARGTEDVTAKAWFSLELVVVDDAHANPAVYDMGATECAGCHLSALAYVVPVQVGL